MLPPATPRGAPQKIPRPADWAPGGPAPWHGLEGQDRRLTVSRIHDALRGRGPGRLLERGFAAPSGRTSAVLCPLFDEGESEDEGAWVILTRRSPALRSHTHEVSFPGGRHDPEDADHVATALREAHEEVALDPSTVTIIGELDRFVTGGSGSLIHPFVGQVPARPDQLTPNPGEVESIRIVALSELLDPQVWREEIWTRNGAAHRITFFELEGDTVWGATASMLRSLFVISLGLTDPPA